MTIDHKMMLNLRSISSIHSVAVKPVAPIFEIRNCSIAESGIYLKLLPYNEARCVLIAGWEEINKVAETEMDVDVRHLIHQAINDTAERELLLDTITFELKYKLLGNESIIDIWEVVSDGLSQYCEGIQEYERQHESGDVVTSLAPAGISGTEHVKPFVFSSKVMDGFSSDRVLMDDVMMIQGLFRSSDWGHISNEQLDCNTRLKAGKGTIGRYPVCGGNPAIIITDEGSEYRVRYENEPAE
jgi:hypothetical protein